MAALGISGTLRAVEIAGVSYEPAGDIDMSEIVSAVENSSVRGYGSSMRKMVSRAPTREGVVLLTNADERAELKSIADNAGVDVTLSYINAAGDKMTAPGWIEMENNQTAENRTTVQLHPRRDWTVIVGQAN